MWHNRLLLAHLHKTIVNSHQMLPLHCYWATCCTVLVRFDKKDLEVGMLIQAFSVNNGSIIVNLEFSLSFLGLSFLGLDPNIYFIPEINFISQLLIVSLFLQCFAVKPGFELFSHSIIALWLSYLELGFSDLGFKTRVFNSQFLTQTDFSFSRFPNFKPKKDHSLVYFNRPN